MSGFIPSSMLEWRYGRRLVRSVYIGAAFAIISAGPAISASMIGEWARGDGNANVRVAKCGDNVCATNIWIKPGTGREKVGDVLEMTLSPSGTDKYVGSAFDPQRNMTYRMTLTLRSNAMTTSGCVLGGLLCRSVDWKKLN